MWLCQRILTITGKGLFQTSCQSLFSSDILFWLLKRIPFSIWVPVFGSRETASTPCARPNLWTIQDKCQLLAYDPRGGLGGLLLETSQG